LSQNKNSTTEEIGSSAGGRPAGRAAGQAARQAAGQAARQAAGQAARQAAGQAARQAAGQAARQAAGRDAARAVAQAPDAGVSRAADLADELAREQAYVSVLYERLDALRAASARRLAAVWLNPTADNDQAWSERDSLAGLYAARGAELEAAERSLCFGRLDLDDAERLYIGRLGLRSADHDLLLIDWRAPASEPFYRATPLRRCGVTRRRHLRTAGRRVVGIDDDVLDLDAAGSTRLAGEAALLASLRRGRTGRMGDIVATIQADQDRIIREDPRGILVVEGGPGTGKTVVALHRVAYLLYTYRKQLARRGILVIGPNATFLRYIDQVLPSLGENDVVLATIGSLYPGVNAAAHETPRTAQVKGDAKMAGVLARAVAGLPRVPSRTVEVTIGGSAYRLAPGTCRHARDRARRFRDPFTRAPLPHNAARRKFASLILDELVRQAADQLGGRRTLTAEDEQDLRAELAAEPAVRQVLDMLWPEFTPERLLALLYAEPQRLDLPEDERAALYRPARPGSPGREVSWTAADVPLLDELAGLLGSTSAAERSARRRRAWQQAESAAEAAYTSQVVDELREAGAIAVPPDEAEEFAVWIAGRQADLGPRGALAERALPDRQWAYGHVVVDEAQELSAMAWRMLARRCPSRSMTVVGDLDQAGAAGGAGSWAQVLDPVAAGRWRIARLTVNYRTPRAVMALAATLLPPGARPPDSVRDSGEPPWLARAGSDLVGLVRREVALAGREAGLTGAGRVAVIAPADRAAEIGAALGVRPGPDLDAPVTVLTPELAKGLEFDSVVIVDPAGIERASPRGLADLYVALTRTTRRLGLALAGEAPVGSAARALASALTGPAGPAQGCRGQHAG
jgi:DNA helicase IV